MKKQNFLLSCIDVYSINHRFIYGNPESSEPAPGAAKPEIKAEMGFLEATGDYWIKKAQSLLPEGSEKKDQEQAIAEKVPQITKVTNITTQSALDFVNSVAADLPKPVLLKISELKAGTIRTISDSADSQTSVADRQKALENFRQGVIEEYKKFPVIMNQDCDSDEKAMRCINRVIVNSGLNKTHAAKLGDAKDALVKDLSNGVFKTPEDRRAVLDVFLKRVYEEMTEQQKEPPIASKKSGESAQGAPENPLEKARSDALNHIATAQANYQNIPDLLQLVEHARNNLLAAKNEDDCREILQQFDYGFNLIIPAPGAAPAEAGAAAAPEGGAKPPEKKAERTPELKAALTLNLLKKMNKSPKITNEQLKTLTEIFGQTDKKTLIGSIKDLQTKLNEQIGKDKATDKPASLVPDGILGPKTVGALQKYATELPPDSLSPLQKKIVDVFKETPAAPAETPTAIPEIDLRQQRMQQELTAAEQNLQIQKEAYLLRDETFTATKQLMLPKVGLEGYRYTLNPGDQYKILGATPDKPLYVVEILGVNISNNRFYIDPKEIPQGIRNTARQLVANKESPNLDEGDKRQFNLMDVEFNRKKAEIMAKYTPPATPATPAPRPSDSRTPA